MTSVREDPLFLRSRTSFHTRLFLAVCSDALLGGGVPPTQGRQAWLPSATCKSHHSPQVSHRKLEASTSWGGEVPQDWGGGLEMSSFLDKTQRSTCLRETLVVWVFIPQNVKGLGRKGLAGWDDGGGPVWSGD